MKGTFFQRPLEFNLEITGEAWCQGDPIEGILAVKNHGTQSIPADIWVHLAHGTLRKVRQKTQDAFNIISSVPLDSTSEWKFQTEPNCAISDTTGSLFILYGLGASPEKLGQLQLQFNPHSLIQEFVRTLTIQFRFILKSQKWNRGRVEVKLAPPSAKAFAMLDQVLVCFRFEGDLLEIQYVFQVKKFEPTATAYDVTKLKREITQTLRPEQYRLSSGRINHEELEARIKEALGHVESKIIF